MRKSRFSEGHLHAIVIANVLRAARAPSGYPLRRWLVACLGLALLLRPTLSASAVHWSGPGGDQWNTNSSPYAVNAVTPFDILWASASVEGQFHRASGVALADVGSPTTVPYLFGSTGFLENRVYRRDRSNGSAPSWVAENGLNDSGTGFRIALSLNGSRV